MLTPIGSFITKTFKVYLSILKSLLPYLLLIFLLVIFAFFASNSKILFFLLIPETYTRFTIHLFGILLFSFISFSLAISIIRLIKNHYFSTPKPKFLINIKESFALAWKNIFALVLLGIPKILVYFLYFLGFNFHVPIQILALLYLLVIFIGILFFFWLSFVVIAIALDKQKLFLAVKTSIMVVKGRVWKVFVRLFLPVFLLYIFFTIYIFLNDAFLGTHIWNILLIFILALLLLPFGLVVPTVLYLELKDNTFQVALENKEND